MVDVKGSGPRLVAMLKLIAEGGRQFSLKDLAGRSGLPISTVHRQLHVLIKSGLIERGKDHYRPGRELYRIASLLRAQFDLIGSARPFLEGLWTQSQETAVFCVYKSATHTASIVDAILTPHPLRFVVEIGMELALPWGSLGRSILAFLPAGDVEAALAQASTGPLSGRSLPPRSEIEADIEAIRKRGLASYYDPKFDVAGMAAPVLDNCKQVIGCIGVTMPSQRFHLHDENDLGRTIRGAAHGLSELVAMHF